MGDLENFIALQRDKLVKEFDVHQEKIEDCENKLLNLKAMNLRLDKMIETMTNLKIIKEKSNGSGSSEH